MSVLVNKLKCAFCTSYILLNKSPSITFRNTELIYTQSSSGSKMVVILNSVRTTEILFSALVRNPVCRMIKLEKLYGFLNVYLVFCIYAYN